MNQNLLVTKRDGSTERINLDKIHRVLDWAAEGLHNVSISQVELRSHIQFYDGIKTSDIHETIIKAAADLISRDAPDYQYLAARLAIFHLRKKAYGQFEPPALYDHVVKMVEMGKYDNHLLEDYTEEDDWSRLQEEMMSILRMANPAKLRARIISLGREYPVDQLINHVYLPVRQRLVLDHNTSRIMSSMFDGALIEYTAASLFEMRRKPGKEAILMAWNVEERARLWLEAWRLSLSGWHISVLADPIESPRPELFPTQTLIVWTGMAPTRRQNELLQHWGEQGYKAIFHAP